MKSAIYSTFAATVTDSSIKADSTADTTVLEKQIDFGGVCTLWADGRGDKEKIVV